MNNKKILTLLISSIILGGCNSDGSESVNQGESGTQTESSNGNGNGNGNGDLIPVPDLEQVQVKPTVAKVPTLTGVSNTQLTYQVAAVSNMGGDLQFSLHKNPSWITIDRDTGLISVSLVNATQGDISFTLIVNDNGVMSTQTIKIYIGDRNYAPVINNESYSYKTYANKEFKLAVNATDANNDSLYFTATNLPHWLTLNAETGEITGTPSVNDYGVYHFSVNASDSILSARENFTVKVAELTEQESIMLVQNKKIDLASLGIKITNPDSIAVDDKNIYLSNDIKGGSFVVLDKKTGDVIKEISSFNKNGNSYDYKLVSDLAVHDGKLYVASLSSNRVDIYDTDTLEIITSLGTGSWAGRDDVTLTHPQGVIATDEYVFVLDYNAQVNVYKQSDIASGKFLGIKKYSYLQLGGHSQLNRSQQMLVKDNKLMINDTRNHIFATYDINDLESQMNRNEAIQPDTLAKTVSMFAGDKDQYLTVTGNELKLSKDVAFTQDSVTFKDTYLTAKRDSKNDDFTKLIDSEVDGNNIFSLKRDAIIVDEVATVKATVEKDLSVDTNHITLAELPSYNVSQMLQDGTSFEDLTDPNKMNFKMNQLIRIEFDEDHNIIVSSFAAQETKNVDINIKMKGTDTWFKAFNIDQLPAFGRVVIPHDKINLDMLESVNGDSAIDLSSFIHDKKYNLNSIFESDFSSSTDKLVQKLKKIKVGWTLNYGKYSPLDGDWFKVTPLYAREWVIMATNFAYAISSPEFEYTWFNFKDIYGKDFYGNDGAVESENGFFTPDEYKKYYDEIINRDWIRIGVTNKGGGLGGGDVWGVDTWIFYSHYYANIPGASLGAVGHEFGHHWGSHDSAWSQEWFGFQQISHQLNQYFLRNSEMPYMDDNINGFYKAKDEDRNGKGVENYFRQYSPTPNHLETYLNKRFHANK